MPRTTDAEIVAPEDRAAWRRWLTRNHAQPSGVWLLVRKKDGRASGVTYEEAVLEALCFGWIDSTAGRHDDDHYRLWLAPRKPSSGWSALNKRRVSELEAASLLAPAGIAAIETARRNGSWDALTASDALQIPRDLAAAFREHPPARRHWDAFPPSVRKQILTWIGTAKRPETRARRVQETATLASENRRANQWRPPPS